MIVGWADVAISRGGNGQRTIQRAVVTLLVGVGSGEAALRVFPQCL